MRHPAGNAICVSQLDWAVTGQVQVGSVSKTGFILKRYTLFARKILLKPFVATRFARYGFNHAATLCFDTCNSI